MTALTLPLTPLEHEWLLDQLQARPTQKRVLGEGMTGDKLLAFREKVAGLKEASAGYMGGCDYMYSTSEGYYARYPSQDTA